MRLNRWSDTRILFWDEVYRVLLPKLGKEAVPDKVKRNALDREIKAIGNAIKRARIQSGWTQEELGERSGLSQQVVSFIENGYSNVSLLTLNRIAQAVGLEVALVDRKT